MSTTAVLYDKPGPKARRRARIGTVVALVAIAALLYVAYARLADRGQFEAEKWAPLVDPGSEEFSQVWEILGEGFRATLVAAALAIALSLALGVVLGVARLRLGRIARIPVIAFIELFRGLPVVITIVFTWRAMVELGVDVSFLPGEPGLWYLVIGLTLYNSVIIAEILRAGVLSLPSGQGEAGRAIGMTEGQVMRSILLPQAFRVMLPALISQLVVILKDTSLVALLGFYSEALFEGRRLQRVLDNPIQTFFVIGLIFIVVNYALSRLATYAERRLSRSRNGSGDAAKVDEVVPVT
ncbi:amino acid ABC transporter permease [Nocardioides marinquilinus]|uniref:Amino acid ABC transporter permease n=1 Tax=Nocardioides marinquilinus TaxID=1210400 RepID=A0ABP9PG80_9ACTN